ncbi:MAG TPA: aldolase/citrate lyase family protein [Roseiarcus sp.]|nr:aldolase/citrate lyase family protein [Roseiarcus sp.]
MATVSIKNKLRDEGYAFGTMIMEFFSAGMPAVIAATGADFALFDMEHTGLGFETLKHLVAGCRGLGLAPLVRVPAVEYHFVARALDVGAHGVMAPMVDTPEQAGRLASFAHYPPHGRRGSAFGVAHDDYRAGSPVEEMATARDRTIVIAQIETVTGLKNVEAIAATPGIDVIWLGHFDLTNFMGIPGQFRHQDYLKAVRRIVLAAKASNKAAGFMAADETWAREYWDHGFRMVAFGPDHRIYQEGLKSGLNCLHALAGKKDSDVK